MSAPQRCVDPHANRSRWCRRSLRHCRVLTSLQPSLAGGATLLSDEGQALQAATRCVGMNGSLPSSSSASSLLVAPLLVTDVPRSVHTPVAARITVIPLPAPHSPVYNPALPSLGRLLPFPSSYHQLLVLISQAFGLPRQSLRGLRLFVDEGPADHPYTADPSLPRTSRSPEAASCSLGPSRSYATTTSSSCTCPTLRPLHPPRRPLLLPSSPLLPRPGTPPPPPPSPPPLFPTAPLSP